jgi:hypothetical protein
MKTSPFAFRHHCLAWNRKLRFPGAMRGRQIKSEIHLLSMLSPAKRRDRLAHTIALHFRWRLRGQYIPSLAVAQARLPSL